MTLDRRGFLKTSSALAAGLVLARHAGAAAKDSVTPTPYAEAIVIDGNLVPPFDDAGALDQATTLAVKSSGLTALKATIGSSAGDFAQTSADIDGFDHAKGGVIGIYELSFLARAPQQPTLNDYLRHLTHALKICGEDHVGVGSDALLMPFDTSPESMVEWNKDIAARKASGVGAPGEGPPPFVIGLNRPNRYRVIADALGRRSYKGRVIDKILGLNFQRVFAETWMSSAA